MSCPTYVGGTRGVHSAQKTKPFQMADEVSTLKCRTAEMSADSRDQQCERSSMKVSDTKTVNAASDGGSAPQSSMLTFQTPVVYGNIAKFVVLHAVALLGLWKLPSVNVRTLLFALLTYLISALGITAGAHRLWSHRSYKARPPLRLLLIIFNTMAAQNSVYVWARDHRVHHKFSETDADPHNANRGFFFAHIGWLLLRKHPKVIEKGATVGISDLKNDRMIVLQHRYYVPLSLLACFFLPSLVPVVLWWERLSLSILMSVLRYVCVLHCTWCVNSVAHLWGYKPYDVTIMPSENKLVSTLAIGEGFHNYHHAFPTDYSTSEYRYSLNLTTAFIDLMTFLGLAYDRRKMSAEMVRRRILRTGPPSLMLGHGATASE